MLNHMSSATSRLRPAMAGSTMDHILSRHAALLLFAVVVLMWGSNWAVTKALVLAVSPLWATAIRSAIATVAFVVMPDCTRATHPASSWRRSGHSLRRSTPYGSLLCVRCLWPPIRPGRSVNRAGIYDAALGRSWRLVVFERTCDEIATGGDRIGLGRAGDDVQSAGL